MVSRFGELIGQVNGEVKRTAGYMCLGLRRGLGWETPFGIHQHVDGTSGHSSWGTSPRKYEGWKKVGRHREMGTPMYRGQLEGEGPHKVSQQSEVPRNKWRGCSRREPSAVDGLSRMRPPTDHQIGWCRSG